MNFITGWVMGQIENRGMKLFIVKRTAVCCQRQGHLLMGRKRRMAFYPPQQMALYPPFPSNPKINFYLSRDNFLLVQRSLFTGRWAGLYFFSANRWPTYFLLTHYHRLDSIAANPNQAYAFLHPL